MKHSYSYPFQKFLAHKPTNPTLTRLLIVYQFGVLRSISVNF